MTYFETTDFEVDTNDADIRLAEELYRMPADDRRRVEEEIHGVGSLARTETPEMIADSLRLFQTEIDCFHVKRAYDDALVINSEYIFDRDFRLRFLRATLFDVSKAARRFCSHLDLLLEKYGPCALQRPLRYSDMSKSGRDLLKNGTIQVLPSRDRAGRLVVVLQGSMAHATIQCRAEVLLYFFSTLSEDVDTQRHGLVVLFSVEQVVGECLLRDRERLLQVRQLRDAMPVRCSALHFCLPNAPGFIMLRSILLGYVFYRDTRVRSRIHSDNLSSVEVQSQLKSFGIKTQELPVSSGGTVKRKNHAQWIKTRRALDRFRQTEGQLKEERQHENPGTTRNFTEDDIVVYPRNKDVLFCRGGKKTHWGNMDFQNHLGSRSEEYIKVPASDRTRRIEIRNEVIAACPGRFLTYQEVPLAEPSCSSGSKNWNKERGGWWVELTDLANLHDRIDAIMYEHFRRPGANMKLHQQRRTSKKTISVLGSDRVQSRNTFYRQRFGNKRQKVYTANESNSIRSKSVGGKNGSIESKSVFLSPSSQLPSPIYKNQDTHVKVPSI